MEGGDIKNKEAKEKMWSEYSRQVKLLTRARLYGGNLIKGVNAWEVSVVRYTPGTETDGCTDKKDSGFVWCVPHS